MPRVQPRMSGGERRATLFIGLLATVAVARAKERPSMN